MINEKLFDDLFLKSHQALAIKSIQTLNKLDNIFFIAKTSDIELYDFEFVKEVIVREDYDRLLLTLTFTNDVIDLLNESGVNVLYFIYEHNFYYAPITHKIKYIFPLLSALKQETY